MENSKNKKTVTAIMQPTFLPWLGYFAMIASCDQFVFLDSVAFAKRSWQQRNKILTPSGENWISLSVVSKGKSGQPICDVKIDNTAKSEIKIVKSIKNAYSKSKYFEKYFEDINQIILRDHSLLVDKSLELISFFCEILEIQSTSYYRSSEMNTMGSKANLLSDICSSLSTDIYLSAPGSKEYISESNAFSKNNIDVKYFDYVHPEYKQIQDQFVGYMSIVDLIFNEGPNSASFLKRGIEN